MREQARRRRRRIVLIGGPGQRPYQRADIEYYGSRLLSIERLDFRQCSIEPIGIAVAIADWQQSIGRERETAAKLLILSKPRYVSRHDQVIAVVAAEQKYADQRPVTGGRAGQRAHHAKAVHRRGNSQRRNRAASDPEEAASRKYQRA